MRLVLALAHAFLILIAAAGARAQSAAHASRGRDGSAAGVDIVYEASIDQLQAAMTAGRVTSVALVDAYLARIAAYDQHGPALNALIRLNPRARSEAAALDAERKAGKVRGPMHG